MRQAINNLQSTWSGFGFPLLFPPRPFVHLSHLSLPRPARDKFVDMPLEPPHPSRSPHLRVSSSIKK